MALIPFTPIVRNATNRGALGVIPPKNSIMNGNFEGTQPFLVACATISNIDISNTGAGSIIDGYTLQLNDYVLLPYQSTAGENAIYVAGTSNLNIDPISQYKFTNNQFGLIQVSNGTTNKNSLWQQTTIDSIFSSNLFSPALNFTTINQGIAYNPNLVYSPGQLVIYNNNNDGVTFSIYSCISQTSGVFNLSAWMQVYSFATSPYSSVTLGGDTTNISTYNQVTLSDLAGNVVFSATGSSDLNLRNAPWTITDESGAELSLNTSSALYSTLINFINFTAQVTYPVTIDTNAASISFMATIAGMIQVVPVYSFNNLGFALVGVIGQVFGGEYAIYFKNATTGVAITNAQLSGATIYITGSIQGN